MVIQVYINDTNQTDADSKLTAKCQHFFGTDQDEINTLNDIDNIFYYALKTGYTRYEIYNITQGPDSMVKPGTSINCDNISTFRRMYLHTKFQGTSGIEEKPEFQALFAGNENNFFQLSQGLLSEYFDLSVIIYDQESFIVNTETDQGTTIIVGVTCIIATVIIFYVIYKYYHHVISVKISNPLVIRIGIAYYDENPEASEIKGYLRDLDGIHIDIKNVVEF